MPSLEEELKARVDIEQQIKANEEKHAAQAKKAEQMEEWQRLDRLLASPDVVWMLAEFQKAVTREHDLALNTGIPPEEAEKARHRHRMAKDMADLLPRKLTELKNAVEESS